MTGDATEPARNGYLLTVACPCRAIFERRVTLGPMIDITGYATSQFESLRSLLALANQTGSTRSRSRRKAVPPLRTNRAPPSRSITKGQQINVSSLRSSYILKV